MDKKLLAILCCPVSHQSLSLAKADLLKRLNASITAGDVRNRDGGVPEAFQEALVTDDGKRAYPVKDGIPVLLEGESISLDSIP